MDFEVIGPIDSIKVIARGREIRELSRLRKCYGGRNWRKLKGIAVVRLKEDGSVHRAELHWYEAHGVGRREMKIKRFLT